jgi:hypothetical protein
MRQSFGHVERGREAMKAIAYIPRFVRQAIFDVVDAEVRSISAETIGQVKTQVLAIVRRVLGL